MTPEEQLKAIINAQVKGGYNNWEGMMDDDMKMIKKHHFYLREGTIHQKHGKKLFACHVIEILLDPKGLNAAYGEWQTDFLTGLRTSKREGIGLAIIRTWISSNGDAAKTIDTAFSLLPK